MPSPLAAREILDREFLAVRSRLIDLGATLDRLDRADGPLGKDSVAGDPRLEKIRRSLEILGGQATDRSEQIQQLFSLPYREDWRQ